MLLTNKIRFNLISIFDKNAVAILQECKEDLPGV